MAPLPGWLDTLNAGATVHDPETAEIRYANEAFGEMLGFAPGEIEQMEVGAFSSEPFSQTEAVRRVRAAAAGHPQRFEWRSKTASGEVLWTSVRLSEMPTDDGTYVIAIVTPMIQYKKARRRVTFLTRTVRHNLRNRAQVIDGTLDLLESNGPKRAHVDRLRESVDRLLDVTDRINDVREATNDDITRTPTDLGALVADTVGPYRSSHPDIEWTVEAPEVYALVGQSFDTAVEELVNNAIAHNPHEELEIRVTVDEDAADNQAYIRVEDTGRPVPLTETEPLEAGYDPNPLSHGQGTGLWLVQSIVTASYGRLSVLENSPDRTTFEICLPGATPELT